MGRLARSRRGPVFWGEGPVDSGSRGHQKPWWPERGRHGGWRGKGGGARSDRLAAVEMKMECWGVLCKSVTWCGLCFHRLLSGRV